MKTGIYYNPYNQKYLIYVENQGWATDDPARFIPNFKKAKIMLSYDNAEEAKSLCRKRGYSFDDQIIVINL